MTDQNLPPDANPSVARFQHVYGHPLGPCYDLGGVKPGLLNVHGFEIIGGDPVTRPHRPEYKPRIPPGDHE